MPHRPRSAEATLGPGPGWLGRILIVLLGVNVVLAWMAIQATFVLAHAVWLAAAGQILAGAEPGRIAGQIARLRLVQAVLWVGAAGLLLAWIHRAHRMLETLGAPGARSARDGLGDCLIPGVNLARIPRVVISLWRVSAGNRTPPAVRSWVAWWWALCLATVVLDLAAISSGRRMLPGLGLGEGLPLRALGECARIAVAVLTIVIVHRIDDCQRQLFGRRIGRPGVAK